MRCPRCQHENRSGAKFCEECAAVLARACTNCGAQLSPTAKFCPECAHPTGVSAAPTTSAQFGSPESYTPRHLAEKILTSKAALEGERKQVTVLFADVKGSMELLADRDPEEARKLLDPVIERMMEAVHRYEGTVNQVMGDGIMALFGAPLAHEDHAVRACYAALRMRDAVKQYAEDVQRTLGVPVHIRIGLNSGEVVVRSIGSDLRMDYTAIGQTTHLAARMEQMATPGSILMTPATLRLAEGYVQAKPLGLVPVKGLAEPVEVHEVTGAAPVRTRLEAAATRGLTRFVGRAVEMAQLRLALEQAREGRGQVAAIVGEPGVGKSRLVWELTRRDPPTGWLVLEAGASSYGRATSYLPVSLLLRSYFKLGERETHEDVVARIGARLSALEESSWPAVPALAALLGVPVENAPWDGLDPRQRRQHTLDVARRLLLRESQIQPVLLILEDLHWTDAETQAWLDGLVDAIPAARLLLLVTYRPEYQHAWGSRTNYTQLRIDPLPRPGAEDLLQALLGADPELASLRALLIERTEGNPFFLEESVRTLVETRALVGERGAYRLAQALDTVQVPATVQAILASRIDRLPPAEKQLLQAAAVIGKDVPFNLLHAIADEGEEDLRRWLAHLQSAEFLYETRLFPESELLERMMEAVHHYEGTVNQVMGDGIMALFGAPLAHEDHAVRACYAALRMQDAVRRHSDELRRAQGVEVQIRVGLNSGDVVVRSIGSDLRMDYTAVGQTTHLAARMEQLAAPGSIRLTAETLRLAEGFVQVTSLGPVPIKGLGEPVEVFELVGAGAARTRLEAAARRGLTRFVGRSAELEQLRDALDRASQGHGQVVAVVGEPGVGKSRLFWELLHSHRVHGWLIVQSTSVSYGKATAYLPVIELLRGYFEIDSRDDPRKIREKVTGKVLTLAPALGHAVPALLGLLDVPVDEASWQALDPRQRRQQMLDAIKRLLLHESEVQPLIVVFEDLHWIDGETQTLLDSLVESLPAARLVLLVNYRPEYQHAWGGKTYYRQLRIDPLTHESADELLDALLGPDAALGPLKQLLIERTEANPLFLEETVRALVETGALAGERGAYRLTRPVEQLTIPATVQAILAARIDRLAPEFKRLLQAAATIGKDVPMPLLLAIADAPESEVRAELTQLQAAEFLYETRLFPDLEYTFKHALTHEVAYAGLLHEHQRALHARITEAIERLSPERVAEQAERLAHHALRGELWDKAVAYLRQAGLRAMARGANREAVAHLEQALGALPHLPESRERTELAIDIHIDLRNALSPLADLARMGHHLHEAEVRARTLGDPHRLARIANFMVIQCLITGDYDGAVSFGQEALSIARMSSDRASEVVAMSFLGQTRAARGEFSDAASFLNWTVALESNLRSERFGTIVIQSALAGARLADVLSQVGQFDEAIGHAEAAVRIAEAADHPYTLYFALLDLGLAHLRRGDLPRATRVLERGLDLCRTWQIAPGTPVFAATLGAAYGLAARADEALPLVAGAVREFRGRPNHFWPALVLLCGGMTYLSAGRIDEAASHAREALALTRRLGARASEAHALCLAGDVASPGGAEDAPGYYREALALAEPRGMRPLVAHCHLGLGKLFRRTGKREQAHEHLTTATTMYREMDMQLWLEQAEAEQREPAQ